MKCFPLALSCRARTCPRWRRRRQRDGIVVAYVALITTIVVCHRQHRGVYGLAMKAITATTRSTAATSRPLSCAIIGGGIAGLRCAQVLSQSYDVTVFDTGRLRPGGRCSSRFPGDAPDPENERTADDDLHLSKSVIDHTAQVITVPEGEIFQSFAEQVEEWQTSGVLTKYEPGSLYSVTVNKNNPDQDDSVNVKWQEFTSDQGGAYYGTRGMGSIPLAMIKEKSFNVVQDVWVSPSNGVRYQDKSKQWKVQAEGNTLGYFDNLIIAHNGKCADRLMSKTPAKAVHKLLRVNFAANVANHGGKRMTLNSIYSLTFCLPRDSALSRAVPESLKGTFIRNQPNLRFLTCQSQKYPSEQRDVQVWTLLSSAAFAKKYKAPQEFLPPDVIHNVTSLLLGSLEETLALPESLLQSGVMESRLQLWGAAVPLNTWQNGYGFIYDDEYKVGVCGDWLCHGSIPGAWTSGDQLGRYMIRTSTPLSSVGLEGQFCRCEDTNKSGIGSLGGPTKNKAVVAKSS